MDFTTATNTTTSRNKLKQLLVGIFKSSSLLTSSCNLSTTTTASSSATNLASTASSRALLADVVHEPIFVSCRFNQFEDRQLQELDDSLCRSLSTPMLVRTRKEQFGITLPRRSLDHDDCELRRGNVNDLGTMIENEVKMRRNGAKELKNTRKNLLQNNAYGFTSSSSDVQLSSDENEAEWMKFKGETEKILTVKGFSPDSTEFYRCSRAKARRRRQRSRQVKSSDNWGVCRSFQPLVSVERETKKKELVPLEEKNKRGFAVLKKSSDPYSDFHSSMSEMIIERQIFGAEDLESLLQSYLSLNSPKHHPIIIQAFSDIWVVLFGH